MRVELDTFREKDECTAPSCPGFLIYDGNTYTTLHTEFRHKCDICGVLVWRAVKSPRIVYLEVEGGGDNGTS